jgi:murein DD-endopeptidase MepM/ murein hydrolase activator NlpD
MLVMRFLAGGSLDTGFNGSGYREIDFNGVGDDNDVCERLLILPDQRIVLAGTANAPITGEVGYALVRLHDDGSPDEGFSFDGRVILGDNSTLTSPTVVDVGYDASRQRLVVAANASGLIPGGSLVAVGDGGSFDTNFNGTGRRNLRFSDVGPDSNPREFGATWLRRLLMRPDGSFYLAGTHENSAGDAADWGPTDVALARLRADGSDDAGAGTAFSNDGIAFYGYPDMGHADVREDADRRRVGDTLEDAIFYRGNVLLLSETNRYPEGVWSGDSWDLGPIAPVLAGIVTDRIWHEDFEPDGLAEPNTGYASIPVPAGYGRYCSVRHPISGGFGLLPQGVASDPCQVMLDSDPDLVVDRAGLYSLAGPNNVLATCAGGYVGLHPGNGGAPFDAALAAAAGQTDCIFTAAPVALPAFSRPYTGGHLPGSAQSFNHDPFKKPIDVSDFGQTPNATHPLAHYIDLNGIQKCDDWYGHDGHDVIGGVDEAAADIGVESDRDVVAVAAGRVAAAVPRYALFWSPVGGDPHQREVFVRHTIGTGRYSEQFTTYYAHMSDTSVRRGDAVVAGTVLGRVGTTGASGGEHLHIAVFRHKNLSYRATWELDYSRADFFELGKELAAIDPWGWQAPTGIDPWAWRFKFNDGDLPDYAGSWSIDLWKAGEAPTMDGYPD